MNRLASLNPSKLAQIGLLLVLVLFAVHAAVYWPFLSDDALISLRYAQRLVAGHGLTWSDGEAVEGYTDLLWVLLTAGASALGLPLIGSARALGVLGAVVAIIGVSCSTRLRIVPARLLSGGLSLAACAPLAAWSIAGLEHGFMTGVLAVALLAVARVIESDAGSQRATIVAACALGALSLLRADGVVLVLGVSSGAFAASGLRWRSVRLVAPLVLVPVAMLLGQLAFRHEYYGELVPNTALAKVAFNSDRLRGGVVHVLRGYLSLLPMLVLTSVMLALGRHGLRRERWMPALATVVCWSAYLAIVGGDIFPGWRQLLLAFVPLAALLAEGFEATCRLPDRDVRRLSLGVASVLVVGGVLQSFEPENRRANNEMWEWDGYGVGRALKAAFGARRPLLAVDAAGALPFWSELPSLDMLGLNDSYIAHHPPPTFGHGGIGHELGDGEYVLRRRPDLVAFNSAAGHRLPNFLSGRQMFASPDFHREYQLVRVRGAVGNRAVGELWLRREGGVLGLMRESDAVRLPGYLFSSSEAVAELDERGELVTVIEPGSIAVLPSLLLPAGIHRVVLDGGVSATSIGFRCGGITARRAGARSPTIALDAPTEVDVVVGARSTAPIVLRSARIELTSEPGAHRCTAPGSRVEVTLADLSKRKSENDFWAGADHVVFGRPGARVLLPGLRRGAHLEASVDNNDTYALRFVREGASLGEVRIEPRNNGGGLAVHRVAIPSPARDGGFDAIEVDVSDGDGSYALGHLVLERDRSAGE